MSARTILPVAFCLGLLLANVARAQTNPQFKMVGYAEAATADDCTTPACPGGLSAIEWVDADILSQLNQFAEQPVSAGAFTLSLFDTSAPLLRSDAGFIAVSDHHPDDHSYAFTLLPGYSYGFLGRFYENNIEAVRMHPSGNAMYFSWESRHETGIAVKQLKSADTPRHLFSSPLPSNNRGIEAICFTPDTNLWYVFETGLETHCGDTSIPFYRVPATDSACNSSNAVVYQYPFNRCSCSGNQFGRSLGNGVSDILAFPDKPDALLVLERCFNGVGNQVRLYTAHFGDSSRRLEKQLVFDFNDPNNFADAQKHFTPDNLEGMVWGPEINGQPTLYLISDNNFNKRQRNQLVVLKLLP